MEKKRKIGPGNPLTVEAGLSEAKTKGSLEYRMRAIRRAFYRQHPDTENEVYWVEEIFDNYIIVNGELLQPSEYYYVPYQVQNGVYTFADRSDWEIVELTYQPQTIVERLRESNGKRIVENIPASAWLDNEESGSPRVIHGDGAVADVVNGNGRRYPLDVIIEAVAEARHHLQESLSQGRSVLLGESEHPTDKGRSTKFTETIVAWKDIGFDPMTKIVKLMGHMIENTEGKDAIVTMDAGVRPGISLRGFGESIYVQENGRTIEEVQWLRFTGFDLVRNPAFEDAGVTALESKRGNGNMAEMKENQEGTEPTGEGALPVNLAELTPAQLRVARPDLADALLDDAQREAEIAAQKEKEAQEKKLAEAKELMAEREAKLRAALGIGETDDLEAAMATREQERQQLAEAEAKRQVSGYVEKEVAGLKAYPEQLRKRLLEAVELEEAATIEEAKAAIIKHRSIFDKVLADMQLAAKGNGNRGLLSVSSVFENETGIPEFARASHIITENLRKAGFAKTRNLHSKEYLTPAEKYTVAYLEAFDQWYKGKLLAESKQFNEAETSTDLNLPYSVLRALVAEAFPELVAAQVFDFNTIDTNPTRVYYEYAFSGETGYEVAVTGSANVNAAAADTWYALSAGHKRLIFSTLVMEPNGGGTAFTYGVDYLINLEEGKYMILSTGSMSTSTNYDLDYSYNAVRKGEGGEIERAKITTAFETFEAVFDRLAVQITQEAIAFSRSQLGWDAAMNSIQMLIKRLRLLIERNLFITGVNQALTVANNIGGTWNSSTGTKTQLVEAILAAATNVENRLYTPTFILMSKTRGNDLVLWDGFSSAGKRPGFELNGAPNMIGDIKEIPVWTSTEMPDGWILVGNRQLVQHRVYQPAQLKGPYQVTSNDKLVDSEEYFVREANGTIHPIAGKGSVVRVI